MTMSKRVVLALGALLLAGAPASAAYPERPITIVVPFPAGGSSDISARFLGNALSGLLGQPVVIDNRAGANGAVGAEFVARSRPDGYTLLVGSIGTYAINPVLYPRLPYQPSNFDLVTVIVRTPNALVAAPNFPANTVEELIAHLRANPERVSFASSGTGSSDHLTAALFWQRTGTTGVHIPYRGGAPAHNDLMGGHANVSFQNLGAISNYVRSGRMKLLAVTGAQRDPGFPNVPTLAQAGVPGVEVYSWQALAGPRGMPAEVRERLGAAVRTALADPALRARFAEIGFDVVNNSAAEFGTFLDAELARWREVVTTGRITAEQ